MTSPLVDVEELAGLLDEVTLLDVRYRMGGPPGRPEFESGHVPGAAYVDLDADLAGEPGARGRHPLPAPERLQDSARRAGVRADRPVVVYDDWQGRAAARCWWLLRWAGHGSVSVLDGGWAAWRAAGLPVESGLSDPPPGDFVVRTGSLPTLLPADVLAFARDHRLLDARDEPRFRGEVEPVDPVAGHVPGARNVPTGRNLAEDGRFRSPQELREVYAAAIGDASEETRVAAYCGSGVTATHDLLALAVIGIEGALYPGSWSEWVADPTRPVATGP